MVWFTCLLSPQAQPNELHVAKRATVRFLSATRAVYESERIFHVALAAYVKRHTLMKLAWNHVEDAFFAGRCSAASLLCDHRHRCRFVQQAQLTVCVLLVGGIREDAALEQR